MVVIGSIVHALDCISSKCINYQHKGALVIGKDGFIEKVLTAAQFEQTKQQEKWKEYEHIVLKPSQMVMPGFIDTHAHAPQYFNCGLGLDLTLLDWLNTYTFPVESKFSDLQIADRVYKSCVRRSLLNGTTSVYFGTIHKEASVRLSELLEKIGQRACKLVVKVD